MWSFLFSLPLVYAAQAPVFVPPSQGPLIQSSNYGDFTNGSLPVSPVVPGKVFDRFVQFWFENTNFDDANTTAAFRTLAQQGILLDNYFSLTHPSQPEYASVVGGDYWGMGDDDLYNIPANISTVVDLLEEKNITWASYQESMPTVGYQGFNFAQPNYLNSSAPPYTYYVRKHNPTILYDSVATVPARLARHRNFNDLAADVNASAIPQWLFITPNLVNDGHDTSVAFAGDWINFWIIPMLKDPRFNNNRTLITVTFDEDENNGGPNRVFNVLLGGAVPTSLHGTTDSTYHTHYSALSTVEANWGLNSLGRGDTDPIKSNVFAFVASQVGHTNNNITGSAIPLTNSSGLTPGPLNPNLYTPFTAPNMSAIGAGGGSVFVAPGLNLSLTAAVASAPVNLTALNQSVPAAGAIAAPAAPGTATVPVTSATGAPPATKPSGARRLFVARGAAVAVFGAVVGAVFVL
ncbi:hypothetical protein K439DRAFT_1612981 [Ramaria rubella]|nr:hypothetical protein K439DRAFT_1612981 [Ramaria rubella]